MKVDESYVGREHSLIKHKLLENYLKKLLFIVGRGGKKEITYIDCFAGPWGDHRDDLSSTSIAISLNQLKEVADSLSRAPHNISNLSLKAIYVEKNIKVISD